MPREFRPQDSIYTPGQFATATAEYLREARNNPMQGLKLGLPGLDGYFAPMPAGRVCILQGQTSNYKSGVMKYIENQAARQIMEAELTNKILIHVSVEDLIEEQGETEFARYAQVSPSQLLSGNLPNWDSVVHKAAMAVEKVPVYRIGESLARPDAMPYLSITNMARAIDHLLSILRFPAEIAGLYFDYIQAFPIDLEFMKVNRDQQRRLQVREDFFTIRQLASKYACPAYVAVQAKQTLHGAKPPLMIPGMYDGEETSALAQRADRILSVWMPARSMTVGDTFDLGPLQLTVTDDLLLIKVVKQRGNLPAGAIYVCRIDFATNTITNITDELQAQHTGMVNRNREDAYNAAHPAFKPS